MHIIPNPDRLRKKTGKKEKLMNSRGDRIPRATLHKEKGLSLWQV